LISKKKIEKTRVLSSIAGASLQKLKKKEATTNLEEALLESFSKDPHINMG
jgi:hypothetical protein